MRTLQHLETKTKIFIDCYTHSQYFDTICGKYVASFCCKKCRVKRYCFFLLHIFAKKQTAKKKYFAQYVSKHGGGMQNFYDCI